MNHLIPRTCTELSTRASDGDESKPLASFRDASAYVLLGDPGSGKTTAFTVECEELGDEAYPVSAREFLTFSPEDAPEWRGKTLFIDGLDEVRAGLSNARTPLDQIRSNLSRLGKPKFRISCRAMDWLGDNDRSKLGMVSPSGNVTTLILDALTEADVLNFLQSLSPPIDVDTFIERAKVNGVFALLFNPQSLHMLVELVAEGADLPSSRKDVFEKFCTLVASEHNEEHQIGAPNTSVPTILDAAGRLCAVQLLSGVYGYTTDLQPPDNEYIEVSRSGTETVAIARNALVTKLFRTVSEGKVAPVHRQIAEFLAARHLAAVIDNGLPAARVVSLMTGVDESVVTDLRGLAAWVATLSRPARRLLIDNDPVGIGLYGDIREFSIDEKCALLESLKGRMQGIGNFWALGQSFESLASSQMLPALKAKISDSCPGGQDEIFLQFMLMILSRGGPFIELSDVLFEVVLDDRWWPTTRQIALEPFIHNCGEEESGARSLRQLLQEVHGGTVSDPDHGLLGIILDRLYPVQVPPSEVWDYLFDISLRSIVNRYRIFWDYRFLERTTDDHIVSLIESFIDKIESIVPALRRHYLDDIPFELLERALRVGGDTIDKETLYDWLGIGALRWRHSRQDSSLQEIRKWLEDRPHVQREVILEGLSRSTEDDNLGSKEYAARTRLYGTALPRDTGHYCLDQSTQFVNSRPWVAVHLLEMAFIAWRLQKEGDGLSIEVLKNAVQGNETLTLKLDELLSRPVVDLQETEEDHEYAQILADRQRQEAEWIGHVRANERALRENRADVRLLHDLARGYFGLYAETANETGVDALSILLGGDEALVGAVLSGFIQSIDRQDAPVAREIIDLSLEGKSPWLSLPILAGMSEIERSSSEDLYELDKRKLRTALASYFSEYPASRDPRWYLGLLLREPITVACVLAEFAVSELRGGKEYVQGLWNLAGDPAHSDIARLASLRILLRFPAQCNEGQLKLFDHLLIAAIRHADRRRLQRLIDWKISLANMDTAQRAYWLATGLVTSPDVYRDRVESFALHSEENCLQIAMFFRNGTVDYLNEPSMSLLIRMLGKWFGRELDYSNGPFTQSKAASELVRYLINSVAASPTDEACELMDELVADESLSSWCEYLRWAREDQRVIRRDALFRHPSPEEVNNTLNGGTPASPGDLAALLCDKFVELGLRIRNANTDDWRQYWNEGPRGIPQTSKIEDHCRDALLSDLRQILPEGIDAQPEGQYASDRRSDIRASYTDFNVPVEIKKNEHRDLWTSIREQLISSYTSDPETAGFGIYLVFWFGPECIRAAPPQGERPPDVDALKSMLEDTLSPEESKKISVCVIDVSQR